MNKKLFGALLCGVVMFSAGVFSSCNDDSNLETRMRIIEGEVGEMQNTLAGLVAAGKSIKKAEQAADGSWTLTLSGEPEQIVKIGVGGGSNVTVVIEDGKAIITVGDKEYVIPMGSAVSSLVYRPEFTDGIVMLGNANPATDAGATVKFLATPAVSADALANATFDIADIYQLQARTRAGGGGLIRVKGAATLDGDGYINVPLKGLTVTPGESYSVAVQMNISGTSISSNYFTVQVAGDFAFDAEDIGGTVLNPAYNPAALADDFYEITVGGLELINGTITNFKDLFTTLPDGAEFQIAPQAQQPGGKAQEKHGILSSSLKADGSFAFTTRPGANFNENADRKGFLFNVVVNDQVKAKTYLMINDPIAGMDFAGGFLQTDAEYGGRTSNNPEGYAPIGAHVFKLQESFSSYSTEGEQNGVDWVIIHNGRQEFFGNWPDFTVGDILYNDGSKLVLGEEGETWATLGSRGIYWFMRGFVIGAPEGFPTYVNDNGKEVTGGKMVYDEWGPQGVDFTGSVTTMPQAVPYVTVDPATGDLHFTDLFTGFHTRLAIGACYEYVYGVKRLGGSDQFGMYHFNRRQWQEGATVPGHLDPR